MELSRRDYNRVRFYYTRQGPTRPLSKRHLPTGRRGQPESHGFVRDKTRLVLLPSGIHSRRVSPT